MRLTHRPSRRRSPGLRRAESSGARLRPGAGGDAGESWRGGRPRAAVAGDLFVCDLDAAAFEPALRRAQRRVGESRCAFRQPAGRPDRAHLLQLERAEEGRAAAEEPAGDRAGREGAYSRRLAWPPRIKPVFAHPLPGEGIWKPTGPPVEGGPPVLVTTFRPELDYPQHRRLRRLVRPHAHRARVLSGPLRAAERSRTRADDGPVRPALAAARDLQRRLHLHGRSTTARPTTAA